MWMKGITPHAMLKELIRFTQASIGLWLAFRWGWSYVLQEILVSVFAVYFHYLMCSALSWGRQNQLFGRFLSTCKFISPSWQKNQTYCTFITRYLRCTAIKCLPSSSKKRIRLLFCSRQVGKALKNQFFQGKFHLTVTFALSSNVAFDEKFNRRSAWGVIYTFLHRNMHTHVCMFCNWFRIKQIRGFIFSIYQENLLPKSFTFGSSHVLSPIGIFTFT